MKNIIDILCHIGKWQPAIDYEESTHNTVISVWLHDEKRTVDIHYSATGFDGTGREKRLFLRYTVSVNELIITRWGFRQKTITAAQIPKKALKQIERDLMLFLTE